MLLKFPKTPRVERADTTGWNKLTAVVSEKLDGSNVGLSRFWTESRGDVVRMQTRSGYLDSLGPKQASFIPLMVYTNGSQRKLLCRVLGDRYIMFGEWLYARHRVAYDALPAHFIRYDLYDKEAGYFVSTPRRQEILKDLDDIMPEAPILHTGRFDKVNNFRQFVGQSAYGDTQMEGVYVKVEDDEKVVGRMKVVREGFEKIPEPPLDPLIENRLAPVSIR